jgi:hypothetical protein
VTLVDEHREGVEFGRGCLWAVLPGLLLWCVAVAVVVCAITDWC